MPGLLRYVAWRHLRRALVRTLLVLLSVALAVGMLVCVQETVESAAGTLARAVEDTAGRAQLEVVGHDETGIDEALLGAVRAIPGVRSAAPVLAVYAHVAGASGQRLLVTGLDLLDDATTDFYDPALRGDGIEDSLVFLAKADSIAVSDAFATRSRLAPGDRLGLVTPHGRRDLVVRGLIGSDARGLGIGGEVALMDLYAAQRAFGREHRFTRIDVALAPDADVERTSQALGAALGEAAIVQRPATRGAAVDQMLVSFRLMTAFLSLIALAAAGFLVFSVTSIAVAQRRHEIATLRALGATRRQTIALFVGEAGLLGVLASAAGVGAGTWLAHVLPRALTSLVAATFQVTLDVDPPSVRLADVALYFFVGLGAILAASLLAARHAARVPVVAALRALPPVARGARNRRLAAGAALSALSLGAVVAQSRSHVFLVGGTADLLILLAAFLAAPSLIAALAPRLISVAGLVFGTPAQLALRNVARQGERLAAPVVILTIGLHLVITVGAIAGSFERSILGWIARGSALDLVVTASGTYGEPTLTRLDEGFAEDLRAVPGVAMVRPLRENRVRFRGSEIGVRAWAIGALPGERERRRFDFVEGDAADAVAAVAAGQGALVSQNLAARFALHAGETIALPTPSGMVSFPIVGVVMDYLSQTGTVVVERETYRRLWHDRLVDGFGIELAGGASADETRARIAERFAARFDLIVLELADYLAHTAAVIHRAFFPLRAIEAVTLAIGLLTLLNALLVSLAERFRELGILRANGASTGQLVRMILGEAVATGSVAALLGIAIGLYGSESWIRVHIPVAAGWIVPYVFPLAPTALAVGGALALAALAAVYPARLAARRPIVAALRAD